MRKIKLYLNIALLLLAHGVYGAAATNDPVNTGGAAGVVIASAGGPAVLTTPSTEPEAMAAAGAGAGAAPTEAPYDFEAIATEMLSKEPYKSRHASDCMVLILKSKSTTTDGKPEYTIIGNGTGTLMQTPEGHLFVLTAAHVIKKSHMSLAIFSDGSTYCVTTCTLPALGTLGIEEGGFTEKDGSKYPISIITNNGKTVSYNPPYFAWDGATVTREDGSEEFVPGLNSLSGHAYEERISLIRDYAMLFLDRYPTGIAPAQFASAVIKPELLTIPGSDAPPGKEYRAP